LTEGRSPIAAARSRRVAARLHDACQVWGRRDLKPDKRPSGERQRARERRPRPARRSLFPSVMQFCAAPRRQPNADDTAVRSRSYVRGPYITGGMKVTRPLRSNFEAGSVREASRRAQWKALGLTDADIEKPKIAV